MSSKARSPAVLAGAVAIVAVVLSLIGVSLAVRGQAQVAEETTPMIEVSNTCTVVNTTSTLTIWGAGIAGGQYDLITENGAALQTTDDLQLVQGHFQVGASLTPTKAGPDQVRLVLRGDHSQIVTTTPINVSSGPCPASTPPTQPCFATTAAVPLSVSGVLPVTDSGTASWYLDYPGSGLNPVGFATSTITDGATTSASLPGGRASPGVHQITVIAEVSAGPPPEYWTFSITFCQSPSDTTSTTATTGSTVPSTTTTTARTTTTTRAPTTTTTTFVPITTSTVGPAPVLSITPTVASTGGVTQVRGSGFPPNSAVILEWEPGTGIVTAPVGPDGKFAVSLLVMPNDQTGSRLVHASGYPGTVSATLLVERGRSSGDQFIFRQG